MREEKTKSIVEIEEKESTPLGSEISYEDSTILMINAAISASDFAQIEEICTRLKAEGRDISQIAPNILFDALDAAQISTNDEPFNIKSIDIFKYLFNEAGIKIADSTELFAYACKNSSRFIVYFLYEKLNITLDQLNNEASDGKNILVQTLESLTPPYIKNDQPFGGYQAYSNQSDKIFFLANNGAVIKLPQLDAIIAKLKEGITSTDYLSQRISTELDTVKNRLVRILQEKEQEHMSQTLEKALEQLLLGGIFAKAKTLKDLLEQKDYDGYSKQLELFNQYYAKLVSFSSQYAKEIPETLIKIHKLYNAPERLAEIRRAPSPKTIEKDMPPSPRASDHNQVISFEEEEYKTEAAPANEVSPSPLNDLYQLYQAQGLVDETRRIKIRTRYTDDPSKVVTKFISFDDNTQTISLTNKSGQIESLTDTLVESLNAQASKMLELNNLIMNMPNNQTIQAAGHTIMKSKRSNDIVVLTPKQEVLDFSDLKPNMVDTLLAVLTQDTSQTISSRALGS